MDSKWYVDESKVWFREESGWPQEISKNMEFPAITLVDMFEEACRKYPDKRVGLFLGEWKTYADMARDVDSIATGLRELGINKGDVVGILLPNSFQYMFSYYGALKAGAIVSPINPLYKPGEVLHQLKTVGAKAVITLDALYSKSLEPILNRTGVEHIIATNIADYLPGVKRFLGKLLKKIPTGPIPSQAILYRDLVNTQPNPPQLDLDPQEDPAVYLMTGGTTGVPKAAVLTHFNLVSNTLQCGAWLYKRKPNTCNIGILPFFHSFGMTAVMNLTIHIGGWIMLFPKPPAMSELCEMVEKYGEEDNTFFLGAEVLFQKMADYLEENPGKHNIQNKITLCISGAGPLHRPVQEKFESVTGATLVEGYGLTEASPVVSAGPLFGKRKIGTIGLPMPGTEWKIMDPETTTKELPPGKENQGELCVAGPQVMKEYLNKPDETAETLKKFPDGKTYLLTGDMGYMDEDGQVVILDRKKQLIKYKGFSVFPKEVEELVGNHPQVSEVAVHGIPHPEAGEVIKAWVVLRPEAKGRITEDELIAWCKENMAYYKVPTYIEFRDELPKTNVGKVLRRKLAEEDPLYQKYQNK